MAVELDHTPFHNSYLQNLKTQTEKIIHEVRNYIHVDVITAQVIAV